MQKISGAVAEWLRCLPFNPGVTGLSPTYGHDKISHNYDTNNGWSQEADSRVIYLSCENLSHNQTKMNIFKLNV